MLVQRTCRNHGLVLACDQVRGWLADSFLRFCEISVQTNRQTNRQMKRQSEIAYLPKFADIMHIVMVIVIADIVDYIDVWQVWKSIGLHVLAYDANALYPSLPIRPVLWRGDLVIGPLSLKINRVLFWAKMHLCVKFCEAMSQQSGKNMRQFYLNMTIEGQLWRHAVT